MNAKTTTDWGGSDERPAVGLTIVALAGMLSAVTAALLIWTLISSPAEVTTAAADGVPELLHVVLSAVYDAMQPLLAWI
jgi:hypothetical protein